MADLFVRGAAGDAVGGGAVSVITYTIDCTGGDLAVTDVCFNVTNDPTINSVTIGAKTASLVDSVTLNSAQVNRYQVKLPATGTQTVTVTFANPIVTSCCSGTSLFNGTNQTTPLTGVTKATGTSTAVSVTLSNIGAANSGMEGAATGGTLTLAGAQSEAWVDNNQSIAGEGQHAAGGASRTFQATVSPSSDWAAIAHEVNAAPSGTAWASIGTSLHPGRSPGYAPYSARFWQSPWGVVATNPNVTATLTGASATFTAGTVVPNNAVPLTGAKATFTPGTLAVSHTQALTGQKATFSPGTLGVTHTNPLTGQRATFSRGIVSSALSVPLAGSRATFGAGTVTPITGLFVALTGASATFAAGVLTPSVTGQIIPTRDVTTVGGITQWTLQIPRIPEKKRITFVRNTENMDRADIADIVSFLRRL